MRPSVYTGVLSVYSNIPSSVTERTRPPLKVRCDFTLFSPSTDSMSFCSAHNRFNISTHDDALSAELRKTIYLKTHWILLEIHSSQCDSERSSLERSKGVALCYRLRCKLAVFVCNDFHHAWNVESVPRSHPNISNAVFAQDMTGATSLFRLTSSIPSSLELCRSVCSEPSTSICIATPGELRIAHSMILPTNTSLLVESSYHGKSEMNFKGSLVTAEHRYPTLVHSYYAAAAFLVVGFPSTRSHFLHPPPPPGHYDLLCNHGRFEAIFITPSITIPMKRSASMYNYLIVDIRYGSHCRRECQKTATLFLTSVSNAGFESTAKWLIMVSNNVIEHPPYSIRSIINTHETCPVLDSIEIEQQMTTAPSRSRSSSEHIIGDDPAYIHQLTTKDPLRAYIHGREISAKAEGDEGLTYIMLRWRQRGFTAVGLLKAHQTAPTKCCEELPPYLQELKDVQKDAGLFICKRMADSCWLRAGSPASNSHLLTCVTVQQNR
ncbi:uncharacterized protein MYCFIDRAFT_174597 [Pseudocercospora fijiensis CIRAD86]|uniref:Uncharacterized protein n=1 Tax=Pseudocercospora fijiensis (strain CIRAD86) TaxID=383855 RepID=M3B115_PSEFD|nr:uncharacterized protein MYCFIDRAFT_174597 [Pseudocercospora fijiensis CIRAD86]EME83122.1 hypothetical protein MYCFIDRAFT_174597 [Pseudocercospora fijiensis CIRAD86]